MIRTLFRMLLLVLGLTLGLALAVLIQGRMADLRLIAGDRLPVWSQTLSDDTGLRAGRKDTVLGLLPGRVPVDMAWQFQRLSLSGLHYTLRLTGQGGGDDIALTLRTHIPFWPANGTWKQIAFTDLQGDLALNPTYTAAQNLPLTGRLLVADGAGLYDLDQSRLITLTGLASLADGTFDGQPLGPTRLTLSAGDPDEWLATLTSTSDALMLNASLRGRFDQSTFSLQGDITSGDALPESWQRGLTQSLSKSGDAWVLPETLDLQNLGF